MYNVNKSSTRILIDGTQANISTLRTHVEKFNRPSGTISEVRAYGVHTCT